MKAAGQRAQVGYRQPRYRGGQPSIVAANYHQREFDVSTPNGLHTYTIVEILTYSVSL